MDLKTKVTFSKLFTKQLQKVPKSIQKKVQLWVFLVESVGLKTVSISKGLHDEPLHGSRWGQRSVRMNRSYRLIYRILDEQIHIEILEVNKHDY